ncbi:hypothetical protein ACFY36_27980 [Actinoplanes sp. NPDC000266]
MLDRITLTQFQLGDDGAYRENLRSDGLIALDGLWGIALDLPALTAERDRLVAAAS